MKGESIVSRNPEVMGADPVSTGTRVGIRTFVDHLKAGHSVDDFLEGFPSVDRKQAEGCLEMTFEAALGRPDANTLR
ncbi:MAG: DUF433 domain-containing protein [Actinomycetota bacterium]|nr:DUF433 domain-containing protein [Actinomycetota bacterium]